MVLVGGFLGIRALSESTLGKVGEERKQVELFSVE